MVSRARLTSARAARGANDPTIAPAIVPLIEAHAARLEQLTGVGWRKDAEAQARMHRAVQALYGVDAVTIAAGGWLDRESAPLAADVVRRLRPVLGTRAGIAIVLPDAPSDALAEIVQILGAEEPDAFFQRVDADALDPAAESLAEFYGATLLAIGHSPSAGVVALPAAELVPSTESPRGALYTTRAEIDALADPQRVRAAIAVLRARHGG